MVRVSPVVLEYVLSMSYEALFLVCTEKADVYWVVMGFLTSPIVMMRGVLAFIC